MSSLNQDNRLLRIDTPVGKDVFVAVELHGEEANSELFQFNVELLSTEFEITAAQMVGQKVTASIHYLSDQTRYINGIVSQFCAYGVVDGVRRYTATIVPTMWLLTLSQSSTMHSGKTTKDIISAILKSASVDFKYNASANDKREYCIQYQETDFDFVMRLMAEEGLSYYFSHDNGKHELVIVDKNSQYVDCFEKQVDCEEENAGAATQLSRVTQWQRQFQMHTGKLAMTGYLESAAGKGQNTTISTRNSTLKNLSKLSREHHESAVPYAFKDELPDYGSKITQKKTAELILETEESGFDIASGASNCCTFMAGGRFELKHRIKSESGKYLITRVSHQVISNDGSNEYSNHFSCVPAATPVHLAPPANRMRINGPQLATVIEVKAGDSPGATDPQLMVKVRFYWDEKNESCWVRVMQNFATSAEGAVFVPRVDSEVVVAFIGGDPDRPLVTGAVYNSDNLAPQYSKTQSGFKTGVKNFNEFRFDDKNGEEEIYLKAGKDFNFLVVNDETGEIQNNQTLKVVKDRSITVDGKEDKAVKLDRTVAVDGNEEKTVKQAQKLNVDGDQTETVKGDQNVAVKGAHELVVTGASKYKSSGAITIEASTSITLKVGSNKIVIDTSGITIKGMKVKATADTSMELKGSASAKFEGGGMTDIKSGGILNLKGSLTKIN